MSSPSPGPGAGSGTAASKKLTGKGLATRARIVQVAADLIFERGVAGTSIEDVRRAAKVSGSQMTHYFEDKRSLVEAVVEHQLNHVLDFHHHPLLGSLDSFPALRLWADLNVEKSRAQQASAGCPFGSLAGELLESDQRFRAELAAGYEKWAELMKAGLRSMRRNGILRPDARPDALASVLLAAHQGGSLLSQTLRDVKPLRDALEGALVYVHTFAVEGVPLPPPRRAAAARALAADARRAGGPSPA